MQHHLVDSSTRIVAPVVPAKNIEPETILLPRLKIGGEDHKIVLLDMTSLPVTFLLGIEQPASVPENAIAAGLDAIFHGYPVGLH